MPSKLLVYEDNICFLILNANTMVKYALDTNPLS